ncbi:MAG: phenylacetate--CoA ligase family protein [Adlercreutzia equolifaciens]
MRPTDRYVHGLNFALYVGGPDVIGAQRLGALAIWVGAVPSDRLIFVLQQYQPTTIWTSPSYAWTLGEKIKEKGLDPRTDFSIHTIIVAGEPGGSHPEHLARPHRGFCGTRRWSTSSGSPKHIYWRSCAAMCEAKDGLHIVRIRSSWETVHPVTGEALGAGQRGRARVHHAHEEGSSHDPLPHRRYRLLLHREVRVRAHLGPHPHHRPQGRDVHRGRRERVPLRRGVRGARREGPHRRKYPIRVYDENFSTRYEVSVERAQGSDEPFDAVAARVTAALKAHTGVKPARVIVYDAGKLGTSSEHKASRFIDERGSAK